MGSGDRDCSFYVYEHWRPDKDVCFWVGKGKNNRSHDLRRRNRHHQNVIAKLGRMGLVVDVRRIKESLSESDALALECERIAFWRASGVALTNATNGGEGVSGLRHSEETKALLSLQRLGKKNPEHSLRLKGRKLSDGHKKKIGAAHVGKIRSLETRQNISKAHSGRKHSIESRKNMSDAHKGKRHSEAQKQKIREAGLRRWSSAEARQIQSEKIRRALSSPETREKMRMAVSSEVRRQLGIRGAQSRWHKERA